ncbi:HAD-IA family hydrolase [uncultured Endozoicomonas sp.]|uniref:HAD family hydrolase n=1 Tax=uncultured Endozoicomonas sp. TaxID=432652 RepID=UPI00260B7231|nr:HAD-IA family hydrolase [uncultured Endozoicomonas sp.]
MSAIEGIFFDLDGTFLDTADDFIIIVNRLLDEHNYPPMDEQLIRQHVSAGSRALMKLAFKLPHGDELEAKREHFLRYYDQLIQNDSRHTSASPYPGIVPLVSAIEDRNLAWGIVTNKPKAYAHSLMAQAGLRDRCHAFVCPEDVSTPKPDPESLLLACQQAGCSPEKSVYIGDHDRDIIAGKKAGMITIAAHYGYILPDENPFDWQADVNIANAGELELWLDRINWEVPA